MAEELRIPVTRHEAEEWFGEVVTHDLPEIAHEPTRRFLAEVGLPREAALIRFAPGGTRGVSIVLGEYGLPCTAAGTVLLDGATGRVYEQGRYGGPGRMSVDVSTLVRDAGIVEAIRTGRGPIRTAEELFALLAGTEPEIELGGSFWHTSFALWQLSRAAVPGEGLAVRITPAMLDLVYENEFAGYAEEQVPAAIVHEPTRRFLREVGLVDAWAYLDMRSDGKPLPTLAELAAERRADWDDAPEPPADAEHLVVLGYVSEDGDLLVDGRTGVVRRWYYGGDEPAMDTLNTDLSALAFTMWVVGRMRQQSARFGMAVHDVWETIAVDLLSSVDPGAWAEPSGYWENMILDGINGLGP
ncbi:SUKH-4 family immunity protein [Embleya sp. NBC_00896]|uniref:SUKH-4 family immunity protein n=1 Tax=Embleya sp. NBC_00896 TaxID=2975961 RepID=UPI0038659577|nr:SUKH-4 family immunity protein [Embleya sp. NBC_00896]